MKDIRFRNLKAPFGADAGNIKVPQAVQVLGVVLSLYKKSRDPEGIRTCSSL